MECRRRSLRPVHTEALPEASEVLREPPAKRAPADGTADAVPAPDRRKAPCRAAANGNGNIRPAADPAAGPGAITTSMRRGSKQVRVR